MTEAIYLEVTEKAEAARNSFLVLKQENTVQVFPTQCSESV